MLSIYISKIYYLLELGQKCWNLKKSLQFSPWDGLLSGIEGETFFKISIYTVSFSNELWSTLHLLVIFQEVDGA